MSDERQMLDSTEVMNRLGISRNGLMEKVENKEIPAVKIGNKWFYPVSYFESLERQAYENYKGEKSKSV